MQSEETTPQRWRRLAEEVRAAAKEMTEPERGVMLAIAKRYDQLAERAENPKTTD